jgi:hypothetical protein
LFFKFQLEETLSNLKAALRITESRQGHLVDIHDAVEFTKLLLGYLQKAYKCLMVPPDNMKQLWEMKSRVAFRPQLANSELITFAIDSSKLVLSFYAMSAISASLQDPRRNTVEIGSQLYEISQHHRVDCVIPWISDLLKILSMALASCQQLLHKISLSTS